MVAQELHRMAFEREPGRLVIGDHFLRERHGGQLRIRLLAQFPRAGGGEERELIRRRPPHLPQGVAPRAAQRAERIGIGEQAQRA